MDFFMLLCHSRRWRWSYQHYFFIILLTFLVAWHVDHESAASAQMATLGINYGMVADDLPSPSEVVKILQSMSVTQTRIYDANPQVLRAFADTGISVMVSIGNEHVSSMTSTAYASQWLEDNIAPFYRSTKISGILVGNEVFSGDDSQLMSDLIPAIHNIYSGLKEQELEQDIFVSTAHSLAILGTSYPPSAGEFGPTIGPQIAPLLDFLSYTGAPFMINAYPYFAYKADPNGVSLLYVLSSSTSSRSAPASGTTSEAAVTTSDALGTVTDPGTGLLYNNMLDAQVDAIYAAIAKAGFGRNNINVIVSETGWPSAGDPDEAGANLANAQAYNANLISRSASGLGTPAHPASPLIIFIFALFNENLKTGPSSERHYGLFYPNASRVYDFGVINPQPYSLYTFVSTSSSHHLPSHFSHFFTCSLWFLLVLSTYHYSTYSFFG